jgi:hypothetical protein
MHVTLLAPLAHGHPRPHAVAAALLPGAQGRRRHPWEVDAGVGTACDAADAASQRDLLEQPFSLQQLAGCVWYNRALASTAAGAGDGGSGGGGAEAGGDQGGEMGSRSVAADAKPAKAPKVCCRVGHSLALGALVSPGHRSGFALALSDKDAKLAQKLDQLQPSIAVFPRECMGQLAYFG